MRRSAFLGHPETTPRRRIPNAVTPACEFRHGELRHGRSTAKRLAIQEAAAYGISGVPFFVIEEKYWISGAQPAEVFEGAIAQVWGELHPEPVKKSLLTVPGAADAGACGTEDCD